MAGRPIPREIGIDMAGTVAAAEQPVATVGRGGRMLRLTSSLIAIRLEPFHFRLMVRVVTNILTITGILAAVSACHRPQPQVSDQIMQRLRDAEPGMTDECAKTIRFGGLAASPNETDKCYRMMPTQHWRGLWRDALEDSQFCPAPALRCSHDSSGDSIWLTFGKGIHQDQDQLGFLYAIDFVGRRTLRRGHYGHFGMFDQEIIVDRLISIRLIDDHPHN